MKIQERLLCEDMSLEEDFRVAQAMELETANVARIKNKGTEDLHKMCTTKQSSAEIRRRKRLYFEFNGKWYERRIHCPAWGKFCLDVKRKIIFRDSAQTNNEKACHTTCKSKTHTIYPYI